QRRARSVEVAALDPALGAHMLDVDRLVGTVRRLAGAQIGDGQTHRALGCSPDEAQRNPGSAVPPILRCVPDAKWPQILLELHPGYWPCVYHRSPRGWRARHTAGRSNVEAQMPRRASLASRSSASYAP